MAFRQVGKPGFKCLQLDGNIDRIGLWAIRLWPFLVSAHTLATSSPLPDTRSFQILYKSLFFRTGFPGHSFSEPGLPLPEKENFFIFFHGIPLSSRIHGIFSFALESQATL
jgi:hypothetical protein